MNLWKYLKAYRARRRTRKTMAEHIRRVKEAGGVILKAEIRPDGTGYTLDFKMRLPDQISFVRIPAPEGKDQVLILGEGEDHKPPTVH